MVFWSSETVLYVIFTAPYPICFTFVFDLFRLNVFLAMTTLVWNAPLSRWVKLFSLFLLFELDPFVFPNFVDNCNTVFQFEGC